MAPLTELTYKGYALIPVIAQDDNMFAAMLIIGAPDGVRRATGVLGDFPCPLEAQRFALSYGMAEIDRRTSPQPEWIPNPAHHIHFEMATSR
ncbi:hypothetical protein AWB81_07898 [Caballeronia arationis]|jgi:hypothetical protein|uniref:Uncharacterized protein n=1 Tax=Caballeronia arationis TaxID=1777142 RepID=A0A7Z7N0Z8_9BURK|nr:hypothetical protein [Caballeronia arationis]SAL07087.1 hypothetical protein AWB81_07898 [Caballeronia arationis]SOE56163.1 hypothetical protein SAMN05446927_1187 [Caballeronia arationis]